MLAAAGRVGGIHQSLESAAARAKEAADGGSGGKGGSGGAMGAKDASADGGAAAGGGGGKGDRKGRKKKEGRHKNIDRPAPAFADIFGQLNAVFGAAGPGGKLNISFKNPAEREALRAKLRAARDRCAANARACAVEHPPVRLNVRGFDVRIHRRTRNSIYGVGDGVGLCVCNMPTGVLVCTYRPPIEAGEAGPIIEGFCDKVRT